MWSDDRVSVINAPSAQFECVWLTGKAELEFKAPTDGNYRFLSARASDYVGLTIDGKKIIDFVPKDGVVEPPMATLHLNAGTHTLILTTYFEHGPQYPRITVNPPSGPEWVLSP